MPSDNTPVLYDYDDDFIPIRDETVKKTCVDCESEECCCCCMVCGNDLDKCNCEKIDNGSKKCKCDGSCDCDKV